ncbi:MAG: selenium metabolism-associated LysR family transcriptional regulator [Thermodesulfovibrionales bacterium]
MDIHRLKVFESVYRNRSFSKASEELHLSQPTVSDHVRQLEEELGCRLFDRLGRKNAPTPEAETLCRLAREIIEKADAVRVEVGKTSREMTGELTLGASTIPGTYLLPPRLMRFKAAHPGVSFRVVIGDSAEIAAKVLSHDLPVGIVGSKLASPQLQYSVFIEDELYAVCAPSLVRTNAMNLRELASYPMICREEGSGTRKEFERFLGRHNVPPDQIRVAGYFGSTDAVKQAVRAGTAIAILSKFAVADDLKHGTLKRLNLSEGVMTRKFYVVSHRKRALPRSYSILLASLRDGD